MNFFKFALLTLGLTSCTNEELAKKLATTKNFPDLLMTLGILLHLIGDLKEAESSTSKDKEIDKIREAARIARKFAMLKDTTISSQEGIAKPSELLNAALNDMILIATTDPYIKIFTASEMIWKSIKRCYLETPAYLRQLSEQGQMVREKILYLLENGEIFNPTGLKEVLLDLYSRKDIPGREKAKILYFAYKIVQKLKLKICEARRIIGPKELKSILNKLQEIELPQEDRLAKEIDNQREKMQACLRSDYQRRQPISVQSPSPILQLIQPTSRLIQSPSQAQMPIAALLTQEQVQTQTMPTSETPLTPAAPSPAPTAAQLPLSTTSTLPPPNITSTTLSPESLTIAPPQAPTEEVPKSTPTATAPNSTQSDTQNKK